MSREEIIVLHFMCGGVCVQMETLLRVINKREPLKMPSGWCTVDLLQYLDLNLPAVPFLSQCLQEFVTHSAINSDINKPWLINDGSPVICDRLSNSACALFIVKSQKLKRKKEKRSYMCMAVGIFYLFFFLSEEHSMTWLGYLGIYEQLMEFCLSIKFM